MSFEMERRKTDPSVDSRAQENWLLDGNGDITPKADESVRQSSVTEEEKIPGEPLALQEMKKKEDEETLQSVPFFKLFSFADYIDVLLMIIGTVSSLASGVGMSLMTLLFGQLVNAFGETANTNNVVHEVSKVSLRFVYLGIGTGVASFLQVSCWMVTGSRQAARIRSLYLKTILSQDIAFFDTETNTGAVVERMSGDTVLIQDAMGEKVGKFIQQMSTFIGGFVIAFTRGWLLTLIMLSFVPLLILAGATMSMVIAKAAARGQASYTTAGFVVEQTIGSIRTVASYGGEERAINKYKKSLMSAYKSSVHEGLASGLGLGSFLFIIFCSHALVVWYAAKLIMNKGYTGGDVITIIVAVMAGSTSAGQTSPCVKAFAAGQAAAFKMFETINRKPEIDANDPNGRKLDDIRGDIELRNIYFSYPARPDEQIFSGFSLHIPSGMTAALVGESGSGKSTVISLIERFYDPQVGEVLIDGINLKEFQLKWIREKIGLVGQDPVLFACSIKDNIAYGKDGATVEEIKAAVKLANAATFIEKMPQGLDTLVGEHGTQMSGGQKQRIAIARAILKDPCILLLDEATSALDAVSEQVVQEALDRVMINRTTVIVAHRLTTVRNADMIAVIHRGKIIEKGSHSEMLKDPNGAYSQLIRLQEVKKEPKQQAVHDQNKMEITTDSGELSRQQSFRPSVILRSHSLSGSLHVADFPETVEPESDTPPRTKQPSDVPLLRLAYLNKPEFPILLLGVVAAVMNGVIQPIFGLFISSMIQVFYEPPPKLQKDARFWALMFIVLAVASLAASLTQMYFFAMAGGQLIKRIRSMLFEKVVHMEIGWFDSSENSSGTIGARLSVDSAAVRGLVGDTLALIVQIIAAALAGLVIAFAANWELSLIVLALLPFLGVSTWAQVRLTKGFSADAKVMYQEASQVAKEAVGSVRTVASFCAEEKVMELYRRKSEGPAKAGIRQGMISGIGFGISLFLMFGVHAIAFYAGARLVQDGKMTFTDVFRVFYALTMAANGVSQSSTLVPDATKAKVSAASIFSILDRQSKIDPADDSGAKLEDVKGEIEFQHVSFRYPSRPDVNIFQDLCLSVQSGKTVALVGESGSGKSTVISLLQRFYDPDSGRITLDGIEISKLQLRWLRQQMGLVSQEPVLFNDTIRANIAYGNGQATEAEILAAAESANAHKFISGLQQGYETMVGERGVQLSGGQKQRVAIARALVKRPKILLLDEATSALDAESEQVVQEALDGVMVGRTTIVVAHRLSTIKNADIIGVVKNGVIVEKGRHEDLINIQGGIYASLVALHSNASSK